jgi:uncharacterized protein YqhQ
MTSILRRLLKTLAAPAMLLPALSSREDTVGGQALIEGVMMRSKERIAWAVRKPDGDAVVESFPFVSVTKRVKVWGTPVIRGVINLFEALSWGFKALSRSADIAIEEEQKSAAKEKESGVSEPAGKKRKSFLEQVGDILVYVVAFGISIVIFMYGPMWAVSHFPFINDSAPLFNLTTGIISIILFLLYVLLISLWKEMRRVFEYHGAEHKAIFAYEDGKEMTVENIDAYGTVHPRCGTSFLILVALCSMLLFTVIDTVYIQYVYDFRGDLLHRLAVRIVLIPLVAGISYEFLKLSDKYKHLPLVGLIIQPGLWVQRITTRKPDKAQIEIAAKALEAAL